MTRLLVLSALLPIAFAQSFSPIRVAAGRATTYTDVHGQTWSPDSGSSGGTTWSYPARPVGGTTDVELYRSGRKGGGFSYAFTVPNGKYRIRLKFNDPDTFSPGGYNFNIAVNGQTVESGFDVFSAAAYDNYAVDRVYLVNITTGQIAISFSPNTQATVSAIEIVDASGATGTPMPIRVNAGPYTYTDYSGLTWSPDWGALNGDINGSEFGWVGRGDWHNYGFYRTAASTLKYQFNVANGTYRVTLKFAELYPWTTVGGRVFNIALNGVVREQNFDPLLAGLGRAMAIDRSFTVDVTDAQIAIDLIPVTWIPTISAIEIVPETGPISVRFDVAGTYLAPGQSYSFRKSVVGTSNDSVTWTISPNVGSISQTGVYTAPSNITQQNVTVTATSQSDPTKSASAVITLLPPGAIFPGIRYNIGGPQYTDSSTQIWTADTTSFAGIYYSTTSAIANTATPTLYQTERIQDTPNGFPFDFVFQVPNGTYSVKLKFAEIAYNNPGDRVMNIYVNNKLVDAGFDILAKAGGANTAIDRIYNVDVTDGRVYITLIRVKNPTKISAIEIKPGATPVPVTLNPPATLLPTSQSLQFTATVPGSSNQAITWSIFPNLGTISAAGFYTPPATVDPANASVTVTATVNSNPPTSGTASIYLTNNVLNSGWTSTAIGHSYSGATAGMSPIPAVTVGGPGDGVGTGTTDSFQFVSTAISGDATLLARISAIANPRTGGYGGLMFRSGTDPNAATVSIGLSSLNGSLRAISRTTAGASPIITTAGTTATPTWLKLTRSGSMITASTSPDGATWTDVYSTSALGSATLQAGFAVAAGEANQVTTITYDNWVLAQGPQVTMRVVPLNQNATTAGGRSTYQVNVSALNGFSGSINFSLLGLPANASYTISPQSLSGSGSVTLTVVASPGVKAGVYALTLNANGPSNPTAPATLVIGTTATGSLPPNFASNNIGNSRVGGPVTYANGVFALNPPPGNIDGVSDAFQFASQPLSADGAVVARITGVQNPDYQTKYGAMLRTDLTPNAANMFVGVSPLDSTLVMQARLCQACQTTNTPGPAIGLPYWVKLVRSGATAIAFYSPDGLTWTQIGDPQTIFAGAPIYAGVAATRDISGLNPSITFDNVSVSVLVPDFSVRIAPDYHAIGQGGSAIYTTNVDGINGFNAATVLSFSGIPGVTPTFSPSSVTGPGASTLTLDTASNITPGNYVFTVTGQSGTATHTASATLIVNQFGLNPPSISSMTPATGSTASGTLSFSASDPNGAANITWMEVLINGTLDGAGACYVHYDRTSGVLFIRDDSIADWSDAGLIGTAGVIQNSQCSMDLGASTVSATATAVTLNLALTFKAAAFSGAKTVWQSAGGDELNSGWQQVGSWTIPAPSGTLPTGWKVTSVGNTYSGGGSTYASNAYTVSGPGDRIGDPSDSFQFAYVPFSGDVVFVARLASVQNVRAQSKYGIMLREGATPTDTNVFLGVGPGGSLILQWRPRTGGTATIVTGPTINTPVYLRLIRQGTTVFGYYSFDGVTWQLVGSATNVSLPANAYLGFAVESGEVGQVTAATFDNTAAGSLLQVAPPSITPSPGTYATSQNVMITTATSGASIRYTTDGSTPTATAGTLFSNSISVSSTTTIKAIAYAPGMADSPVTLATYSIVPPPQITTVYPASGVAGTQVTISGTGFGATRASGGAWLGSTFGAVVSWSDTQIVATVASNARSGTAQVRQYGAWSNSLPFNVATATITSVSPASAAPGTPVTITGTGFGGTQGSGQVWLGSLNGIVQSWNDTQIVAVVASRSVSGKALVLQGGVMSNGVAFTVNTLLLQSISPASASPGASVTITGTGFGAWQGTGSVLLGSTMGSIVSWSDTQIVAQVGANTLSGVARVQQNGAWTNALTFTITGTTVTLQPNVLTLGVGDTQPIQALGSNGQPVSGLTWASSDASIIQLSSADPPILTALVPGRATITAGGASADVTVVSGPLPLGTTLWSVPGTYARMIPAVPSPTGVADLFAFQSDGTVKAITSDGVTVWTADASYALGPYSTILPDFQGGLVLATWNGSVYHLYRLDGLTGQRLDYNVGSNFFYNVRVHPDGTLFAIVENSQSSQVVGLDLVTGAEKFRFSPPGLYTYADMIIAGDGYAYLPYQGGSVSGSTPNYMRLLQVGSDGSSRVINIQERTSDSLVHFDWPDDGTATPALISNGADGVVLSWLEWNVTGSAPDFRVQKVWHMAVVSSGGGVTMTDGPLVAGQDQIPMAPVLQRQDGTFVGMAWIGRWEDSYSQMTKSMAAFDASGNVLWSVPNEEPLTATEDGGVLGKSGIVYDANGNATGSTNSLTSSWMQDVYRLGSVNKVVEIPLAIAQSWWPFRGGNRSQNNSAIKHEWYPSLSHCTSTPGCIGTHEAIYNAVSDLIVRLSDPTISALAQAQVFNKVGNGLTTQRFIDYIRSKRPAFYDATRSSYCVDALTVPLMRHFCSDFNILLTSVAEYFRNNPDKYALTGTPSTPLLTFIRPKCILYDNLGRNLGNEGTIFHEALHGFTGRYDLDLETVLGAGGTGITQYLRDTVLKQSPGLNSNILCPPDY